MQLHSHQAQILDFDTAHAARELVNEWCEAIRQRNADAITELYSDDAILIPTLQTGMLQSPLAIHRYFTMLAQRDDLRVTVLEHDCRMIDASTAMHTGSYVFRFTQHHEEMKLPARFSFIAQQKDGRWMILHHHSSQFPETNTA